MSQPGHSALAEACWVVTEGSAGMENQALGLAERLPLPVVVKRAALAPPWRWLAPRSVGNALHHLADGSDQIAAPWPRVVIGCGRQSIPIVMAIKRASGGRTLAVQCQHPRTNPAKFDLIVPPEHDSLTGANVFPILGSPNRITPEKLLKARNQFTRLFEPLRMPRIGVLIGGKSRAFAFGEEDIAALSSALKTLTKSSSLMVLTSRRTGDANVARIKEALRDCDAYFWDDSGENPYLGVLAWSDAFLVTADSVNMACEAAATGKPIHIFPLRGGASKFTMFHHALEQRGISRTFEGQIEQWDYVPLDETGRAAKRIKTLLDQRQPASDMR